MDLAVRLASGSRTVCYVEREWESAARLVTRATEARVAEAPLWSDLARFDARPWRGAVDLVAAGYPCQPFSDAGKRLGEADPRHLWPHVRRIVDECDAPALFIENVPGHVRRGFANVLADLAALGFDAEWIVLAAGDLGGTQERKRLWCLAHRGSDGLRVVRAIDDRRRRDASRREFDGRGAEVGDAERDRRDGGDDHEAARELNGGAAADGSGKVVDGSGARCEEPEPNRERDGSSQSGRSSLSKSERGSCEVGEPVGVDGELRRTDRDLRSAAGSNEGEGLQRKRRGHAARDPSAEAMDRTDGGRRERRAHDEGGDRYGEDFLQGEAQKLQAVLSTGPAMMKDPTSSSSELPTSSNTTASSRPDPKTSTHGATTSAPGVLNPSFVEALMGLPIGWTAFEGSAIRSFRSWARWHFAFLRRVL